MYMAWHAWLLVDYLIFLILFYARCIKGQRQKRKEKETHTHTQWHV